MLSLVFCVYTTYDTLIQQRTDTFFLVQHGWKVHSNPLPSETIEDWKAPELYCNEVTDTMVLNFKQSYRQLRSLLHCLSQMPRVVHSLPEIFFSVLLLVLAWTYGLHPWELCRSPVFAYVNLYMYPINGKLYWYRGCGQRRMEAIFWEK